MTRAAPVRGAWADRAPVRIGEVESTQDVARALAEGGAPEGTVVWAEHQTRGRGRLGRPWTDEPGAALLISIVLRPAAALVRLPQISLLAGAAAAEAVRKESGLPVALEWPNDVLLDGRKVAGILAESFQSRDGGATVILGIGLNVNQARFPDDLGARATSLALETGRQFDREKLLRALLLRLEDWYQRWAAEGFAPVREAWRQGSRTLGSRVTVEEGSRGIAVDLAEDGALIVQTDSGGTVRVLAGELQGGPDASRH